MAVARSISTPQGRLTIRQTALPSLALAVVIILGWFFTVRQAKGETGMAGTMGMDLGPFLLMWLPMVVAMMFPTVGLAVGIYGVAGLYQFTSFKDRCRSRCLSTRCCHTEEGSTLVQTVRVAGNHGLICIGCCAAYMVVLITVGMTNIAAMAILTVVIFVERHVRAQSAVVSRIAGVLLLLAAVLTPFVMWLHPGLPGPQAITM